MWAQKLYVRRIICKYHKADKQSGYGETQYKEEYNQIKRKTIQLSYCNILHRLLRLDMVTQKNVFQ